MNDPLSSLALTCRRLFLRNHVVDVRIGAHDFEKHAPQRIVFNVELFVPLDGSTPTRDDLMAELIAHPGVQAVRLSSCKPDVYPDCEGVGVEIIRIKSAPC